MDHPELLKDLRDETLPQVPKAREALERARGSQQPGDVAPVRELLHKVAGSAAPVGLPHLSRLARFGEELAVLVLSGDAKPSDATLSLLERVLDAVDAELSDASAPAPARSPAVTGAAPAPAPPPPQRGQGLRPHGAPADRAQVLLVDGDVVSVKLFGKVLSDHGFELKSMKAPEGHLSLEEGFGDVLLLDVSNGVSEAAKALVALAKTRRVPVVALAKVAREHEVVATVAREVDEFLTKPVAPEAMVATVRTHAERRRAVRVARARAPTSLTPVIKPPPPAAGATRVLVVDDSRVIRGLVREFLAESQVEVLEAEDGQVALTLVMGLEQLPAAAVVDIQMPELDGLGLTRALRADARTRGLPIVLLSVQDDPESQREAMEAGANAYLVKSQFDAPELRRALRAAGMVLSEPAAAPAG